MHCNSICTTNKCCKNTVKILLQHLFVVILQAFKILRFVVNLQAFKMPPKRCVIFKITDQRVGETRPDQKEKLDLSKL